MTVITTDLLSKEGARIFHNKAVYCKLMNKDHQSDFNGPIKTGTSVRVRRPSKWSIRSGNSFTTETALETYNTLTIGDPKGVDTTFTNDEMNLSLDNMSERIIKPQMSRLVAGVDSDLMNQGANVAQTYQNAASTSLAYADVINMRARMVEQALPQGEELYLFANPTDQVQLLSDTKGLFQNSNEIGGQYTSGMMGKFGGFNWVETNLLDTITPPATDVAGTVNGTVANGGTNLVVAGFNAAEVIPKGAVVTVAGVYAVNPETKKTLTTLAPLRVTASVTLSGGAGTLVVQPMYDSTDSRQNVSAMPQDTVVVTVVGTAGTAYNQNLATHKDAFTIAFVDQEVPNGTDNASKSTVDGMTLRFVREWDFDANTWKSRWDVQYGGCGLMEPWSGILSNF